MVSLDEPKPGLYRVLCIGMHGALHGGFPYTVSLGNEFVRMPTSSESGRISPTGSCGPFDPLAAAAADNHSCAKPPPFSPAPISAPARCGASTSKGGQGPEPPLDTEGSRIACGLLDLPLSIDCSYRKHAPMVSVSEHIIHPDSTRCDITFDRLCQCVALSRATRLPGVLARATWG